MPRMTAKYKAAREVVQKILSQSERADLFGVDGETLYRALHERGYAWDNKEGKWVEVDSDFSGGYDSVFELPGGQPSGVYHLRIMAHPADIPAVLEQLQHLRIGNISDLYPNRKGKGVRIYLSCSLKGK